MFVCISNKSQMEANKKLGIVQNVYICDVTTSNVREA